MTDIVKSAQYIEKNRPEIIQRMIKFLQTDTLIFLSNSDTLYSVQKEQWQPLLDIAKEVFELNINQTTTLCPPNHEKAEKVLAKVLEKLTLKELTVGFLAAMETQSVIIGLLLAKKQINAAEAFEKAFMEELYQNKIWGTDDFLENIQRQNSQNLLELEKFSA